VKQQLWANIKDRDKPTPFLLSEFINIADKVQGQTWKVKTC
jgi:hypothetical protein